MFNVPYRRLVSGFPEFKEPDGRPASGLGLKFIDGTAEESIVYR